ncbi:hypothetical protein AVEN_128371-1 [Araneus ventricosus]|uniref:Uncharacterized protein n=1 Tax=Araneus ventricosus TaxID=182803 RepID=A0A4Y2DEL9_ARAVE|nr:hypothetical protein AVEN_128371-1 [Araneus ventricosus]
MEAGVVEFEIFAAFSGLRNEKRELVDPFLPREIIRKLSSCLGDHFSCPPEVELEKIRLNEEWGFAFPPFKGYERVEVISRKGPMRKKLWNRPHLAIPDVSYEGNLENKFTRYHKGTTPVLPKHPESLNNPVTTAVGTKIGVLIAITGHCPNPPEGGAFRHWSGGNSTPHHYCTPGKARTR